MQKVDEVMRAIAAAEGYDLDGLSAYAASNAEVANIAKKDYEALRRKARAAIEAMRGPTPGMLEAGWDAANKRDPNCLEWIHEPIYDAMIDAALKEGE